MDHEGDVPLIEDVMLVDGKTVLVTFAPDRIIVFDARLLTAVAADYKLPVLVDRDDGLSH